MLKILKLCEKKLGKARKCYYQLSLRLEFAKVNVSLFFLMFFSQI